ncbi:C4-dicarboxylate ABC transporter permease, partial [Staphylococcus hominis]
AGLVAGLGFNGTFDALVKGMQDILYGALVVGIAKGIVVLLENGKIIDTIVHGMTTLLSDVPASLVIMVTFVLQFILNFFI